MNKNSRKFNGEGSIYQRSDGRWCASIQDGNKPDGKPNIKYFYSKDRTPKGEREVFLKLNEYRKIKGSNKGYSITKKTVDEYIINWLDNVLYNQLKPTSYDRINSTINNHIIPNIGHIELSELNFEHIQNLIINKMQKDKFSYSSIKKAYDAINACCKYAKAHKEIQFNPNDIVVLPSRNKFTTKEIKWFNNEEIKKFKETCILEYSNHKPVYQLGYGYILMMNTGLRLGEALALKWNNINYGNNTLSVTENIIMATDKLNLETPNKKVLQRQKSTKTNAGKRVIPLNKTALDALNHIREYRYFGNNFPILATKDKKENTPQNFFRTFESIIQRAGIEHCGIHSLRHTFASKLFERGVDVKTVSELLGHANTSITYNTYIHLIKEQKAQAVNMLDDI